MTKISSKTKKMIEDGYHKPFENYKTCFWRCFPTSCSETIVNIHSHLKSDFDSCSENDEVLSFKINLVPLSEEEGNTSPIRRLSLQDSLIFNDFCSEHAKIFSNIEEVSFSKEQLIYLGYSALCFELYNKEAYSKFMSSQVLKYKNREREEFLLNILEYLEDGQGVLAEKKEGYDQVFDVQDFSVAQALIIELPSSFPVRTSGVHFPKETFSGEDLFNYDEVPDFKDMVVYNIVSSGDSVFIVFTWLEDEALSALKFLESLISLPRMQIANVLIKFFLTISDNNIWSPAWWETLSKEKQCALSENSPFQSATNFTSFYCGNWKVKNILASKEVERRITSFGVQWI